VVGVDRISRPPVSLRPTAPAARPSATLGRLGSELRSINASLPSAAAKVAPTAFPVNTTYSGDRYSVDEQLDQQPPLLERRAGQPGLDSAAEGFGALDLSRYVDLACDLRLKVLVLLLQAPPPLLQLAPSSLILGERDDPAQVGLG
jgi:hypothetical protein